MPPRGVKSPKRERQYEHIKESELKEGRPAKVAKRIAAATVNKTRAKKGETKSGGSRTRRGTTAKVSTTRTSKSSSSRAKKKKR